ncbi:MAG: hypothetical protein ABSH41_09870 [Syntrophobacteraceae bacterium]|jgi:hypothetical protein
MKVEELMEQHGFGISGSGGGCEWYTKEINYKGQNAFVAITVEDGCGVPETLEEPILVGIYSMDSGDILEDAKRKKSLKAYLDNLGANS